MSLWIKFSLGRTRGLLFFFFFPICLFIQPNNNKLGFLDFYFRGYFCINLDFIQRKVVEDGCMIIFLL